MLRLSFKLLLSVYCALCFASTTTAQNTQRPVQFNRDVRPLLTDKCFACHGPDAETVEGGLRLDLRDSAIDVGAFEPGDPDNSEMVRRLFTDDQSELMPPPDSHKTLLAEERAILRRWISEGAQYQPHWAYAKLARPKLPETETSDADHPIDRFVSARLKLEDVAPNAPADRVTLIRRLSFDLTGIPPTPAEVDAFVNNQSDDAYEKLVDRLLDSPRFGERMAIYWLDLVRYADTVGYHGDQDVSQSPYRDYVIDAFNSNKRYDQFVREQLAGDLFPNPSVNQLVASGYNRLNQTTEEGGAQPKEYLAIYFADRVRNVSQVFMGATIGCAQCHDHKFDPYTARDFYSLGAFFADVQEVGKYDARQRPPQMRVPSDQQSEQIAELDQRISVLEKRLAAKRDDLLAVQDKWESEMLPKVNEQRETETIWIDDQQNTGGKSEGSWNFISADQGPVHRGEKSRRQESAAIVQHVLIGVKNQIEIEADTRFFTWVYLDPENAPTAIMLQLNDGSWDHRGVWGSDDIPHGSRLESWAGYRRSGELPEAGKWVRLEISAAEIGLAPGSSVGGMAFTQFGGIAYWDSSGWVSISGLPSSIAESLKIAPDSRTNDQASEIREYYFSNAAATLELRQQFEQVRAERKAVEESAPMTVISKAVKPRTVRILNRGNWMDDKGEIVQPAIPAFLGKLDTGDRRATRLDFADWLCDPDNVLTSRTMANRLWYLMFGRGICTSVDDFGGQGTFPSHPELLDWLAVDFVQSGWDFKHTLRTIVTSQTYQQSSKPSPELRLRDPYNDLFARQGRFRIDAEMVRDSALVTSGLLVEKVGGVSAKPYQPGGYYAQLNFPARKYSADRGDNQYRRGVYTHWQRTFLHPMLKAFDAPSREECTAARSRSNTPLQALSLLNDPTFVEAARVFAARIMREGGTAPDERISWAYRNAVSRQPEQPVAAELRSVFDQHLAFYRKHADQAKHLIATGDAPVPADLDAAELAAWTSVARVILNLHEVTTRY